MEQADLELQLKVWKELAISKQVLMQTATKALGLKDDCSTEELEKALLAALQQTKVVEAKLAESISTSSEKIASLETDLKKSLAENGELIAAKEEALKQQEASEQRVALGRSANAEELKKVKAQLADKQREIKNITKVLADTPENVVKKMKGLKKEKMDEANDRKRAEEVSRTLRKDKQKVEQDLAESKNVVEQAAKLAESYRELQKLANEQYNQLAETVKDKDTLATIPALDEELLETIESAASADDKQTKKDKK